METYALSPREQTELEKFPPEIRDALIAESEANPAFYTFYLIPALRSDDPVKCVVEDMILSERERGVAGMGDLGFRMPKFKNVVDTVQNISHQVSAVAKKVVPYAGILIPAMWALKSVREKGQKFWRSYGPIVVTVVGTVASIVFPPAAPFIAAGIAAVNAGNAMYQAKRAKDTAILAADRNAAALSAEYDKQVAETTAYVDKFYNSPGVKEWLATFAITDAKWKKLTLDQKVEFINAASEGRLPAGLGPVVSQDEKEPDVITDTPKTRAFSQAVRLVAQGGGILYNGSEGALTEGRIKGPVLSEADLPETPTSLQWLDLPKDSTPLPSIAITSKYNTAPSTATDAQKYAVLNSNGAIMLAAWAKDYPGKTPPPERMLADAQASWVASGYEGHIAASQLATGGAMWAAALALLKSLEVTDYYLVLQPVTSKPVEAGVLLSNAFPAPYPPLPAETPVSASPAPAPAPAPTTTTPKPKYCTVVIEGRTIGSYVEGSPELVAAVTANSKVGDHIQLYFADNPGVTTGVVKNAIRTDTGIEDAHAPAATTTTTPASTTATTTTAPAKKYTVVVESHTIGVYGTSEDAVAAVGPNSKIGDRVGIIEEAGSQTTVSMFIRTSSGVVDVPADMAQQVAAMSQEQLQEYVVKAEADQKAAGVKETAGGGFPWWIIAAGVAAKAIL